MTTSTHCPRAATRLWFSVGLALLLQACAGLPLGAPVAKPGGPPSGMTPSSPAAAQNLHVYPLPGGLDQVQVFNSNSPELIQQPGITLSSLPADASNSGGAFLDIPFQGSFSVFSHHVADVPAGASQVLYLALVAHNRGDRPVTVQQRDGSSHLTRPEAPFKALEDLLSDPSGTIFAGPGDRVATELMHGMLTSDSHPIAANSSALLGTWSLSPDLTTGRNARSMLLHFQSDGPVYLSEVALYAAPGHPPDLAAVQAALDTKTLAGPHEQAPTPLDPAHPPTEGGFRYGRVAGVSQGDRWMGTLFGASGCPLPNPGERLGFPIASVVLNDLGTGQVQSAPMERRYPDSAYQAHGNYGVTYALEVPLDNPSDTPRSYTFGLSSPLKVSAGSSISFVPPAGRHVTFRGPVRLEWTDEHGAAQTRYSHLVLHDGEDLPPFGTLQVPARSHLEAHLTLIYPADCTPPQMLTIGRL